MMLDGDLLEEGGKGGAKGLNCLLPMVPEAPQHLNIQQLQPEVFMKPFLEFSWLQCIPWAPNGGLARQALSCMCKGPVLRLKDKSTGCHGT